MNQSREDTIINAAANIYAGRQYLKPKEAVMIALEIETETEKQRKAQLTAQALPSMEEFINKIPFPIKLNCREEDELTRNQ